MPDSLKKALYDKLLEEEQSFQKKHPFVTYDGGATGDVLSAIDSVTGAPFRKSIGQMQEGNFGEALKAYKDQFGSDPSLAPSMEDIAIKAGVPEGGLSKAAGVIGSFAEPGIPMIKGSVKGYKLPQINPGEAKIIKSSSYREPMEVALERMKSKAPVKVEKIESKRQSPVYKMIDQNGLENKLEELKSMRNRVAEQLNKNKENFSNKKILSQYDNLDQQIKELEAQLKDK